MIITIMIVMIITSMMIMIITNIRLSEDQSDLKEAVGIRGKEKEDFLAGEKELMETIDTISRAVAIIEREMAKNPASFAQVDRSNPQSLVSALSAIVDAASFSSADHKRLTAFVQAQQTADDEELGAPAAAAYKNKSGGLVDVLEDLKEKAEEQLAALRSTESTAQHNFEMTKQSLEDEIAADTKTMDKEKATKSATEETKATATGDLEICVKDRNKQTVINNYVCIHLSLSLSVSLSLYIYIYM